MLRNLILLVVSVGISVLAAEGVSRLVLNPVDFLMVTPIEDAFLSHRLAPHAGGHDAWGFRNRTVPDYSEIVAIGDSMAYGMMAKSTESWPAHLSRHFNKPIYNLGLGGYGPLQYLRLLKTKAQQLNPSTVIISFYLGNDLFDVYNLAYANDNWASFRQDSIEGPIDDPALLTFGRQKPMFGRVRQWMSENSVLYRIITQSEIFDHFRIEQAVRLSNASFVHESLGRRTILRPQTMITFVDMQDPRIAAALDITMKVVSDIQEFCKQNGIDLYIVVIPVKENVFWPYVREDIKGEQLDLMRVLNDNLSRIRRTLLAYFEENGIAYIDALPHLRDGVREHVLYPEADGHPNGRGYKVIADAIGQVVGTTTTPAAN